jgi:hypothetical protein
MCVETKLNVYIEWSYKYSSNKLQTRKYPSLTITDSHDNNQIENSIIAFLTEKYNINWGAYVID